MASITRKVLVPDIKNSNSSHNNNDDKLVKKENKYTLHLRST